MKARGAKIAALKLNMPENKPMQDKLNRGALVALVASLLTAPVMAEPMSDDAAMQLLQRINDLESEVSNLRGENEQLRNDLGTMQKDQKSALDKVDERMEKLNEQKSSDSSSTSTEKTDSTALENKLDAQGDDKASDSNTSSEKTDTDSKSSGTGTAGKSDASGFYNYGTGVSDDKNPPSSKTDDKTLTDTSADKSDDKNSAEASTKTDDSTSDSKTDDKVTDSSSATDKAEDKVTDSSSAADKAEDKTADKTSDSKDAKIPDHEERAAYDEAFQTLLKEPKNAVPMFRTFLKDYPSSSLAASAQYWIGEALYADKSYKEAIDAFLVVLKEYKGSEKAPDAALKLGYSFYELQEWDNARRTLEDVISFFPENAETAGKAKERLEKMKSEGH